MTKDLYIYMHIHIRPKIYMSPEKTMAISCAKRRYCVKIICSACAIVVFYPVISSFAFQWIYKKKYNFWKVMCILFALEPYYAFRGQYILLIFVMIMDIYHSSNCKDPLNSFHFIISIQTCVIYNSTAKVRNIVFVGLYM